MRPTNVALHILLLFGCYSAYGQNNQLERNAGYWLELPLISSLPPFESGMHAGVEAGYRLLDTLAMLSIPESDLDLQRLDNFDTLKRFIRSVYQTVDYDPLLFNRWANVYDSLHAFSLRPAGLRRWLEMKYGSFSHPLGTYEVLTSDYILHVRATRVSLSIDKLAAAARSIVVVEAIVLDTIKGQIMPDCLSETMVIGAGDLSDQRRPCIKFSFRAEWSREPVDNCQAPSLHTGVGTAWVKPEQEYIVFLRLRNLGQDSNSIYFDVWPVFEGNKSGGMFEVVNHRVNTLESWGLAPTMPIDEFIGELNRKIKIVTN